MPGEEAARTVVMFDKDRRCPRCGSDLLTNGELVWCSFVGGMLRDGVRIPACAFGIDAKVYREEVRKESVRR